MKYILLFVSLFMSNMFFSLNHPITIVINIIIQSLMVCSYIFIISHYSWFALIMFLIFMGGLMVLFIYITSLASNELFTFNMIFFLNTIFLLILTIFIFFLFMDNPFIMENFMFFKFQIYLIFSEMFYPPTLIIMIYLLLTLVITVNIVKLYNAPIRSMI